MLEALEFLLSGVLFGLVAAISPGPLLTLILSETLKYGKREGMKVAIAPLITDTLIVLFVLFILSNLIRYSLVIGIISLLGACFLIYLGVENFRTRTEKLEIKADEKNSLKRGIIANMLNPNPYLFWLFIGGPMIFKGFNIHISTAILFVAGFYSLLIGSNISIVFIAEKSKVFIGGKYYVYIVRALGLMLILFALFFVYEGLRLMGLF